tara:strand:+ start:820 stop:1263 length:444 start_codon:yes stop_codon:yes gene_type:complete
MNTQTTATHSKKQRKSRTPTKNCPDCGKHCHARSSSCECGHIFFHKQLSIVDDWTMLGAGDTIKSIKGHGSYWLNPHTDEKTYMGVYGRLVVKNTTSDGVQAYRVIKGMKHHILEFIYMGKPKKSDLLDNYYIRPHKLIWDKKVKIR